MRSNKFRITIVYFLVIIMSALMSFGYTQAQSTYICAPIDDKCIFQEQYDECSTFVKAGCPRVTQTKSCPPQYQCCFFCTNTNTDNETTLSFTQLIGSSLRGVSVIFKLMFLRLLG